ncbi:hypothetical protein ACP70R_017157 [Stipagrostis hirtigluma subsp. patula]
MVNPASPNNETSFSPILVGVKDRRHPCLPTGVQSSSSSLAVFFLPREHRITDAAMSRDIASLALRSPSAERRGVRTAVASSAGPVEAPTAGALGRKPGANVSLRRPIAHDHRSAIAGPLILKCQLLLCQAYSSYRSL